MDRKVSTAFLKEGMFVSKLDKPWVQTPFLIQGFYIKDENDISTLVEYCDYVYIDLEKGVEADVYFDNTSAYKGKPKYGLTTNKQVDAILDMEKKVFEYIDKNTTIEEMPDAELAFESASECLRHVLEHDIKENKLDINIVNGAVEPVLESMIRNSDAFMWLSKMRNHDNFSYEHSLHNCALGITFGRHMGLNKRSLNTLATGLLLMDIGKLKLPTEILTKTEPLTSEESETMREHVTYGVNILRNSQGIDEDVIAIVLNHHEKHDGTGYPNGLVGTQIPAYGRMAAIIDCYGSMTTTTKYRKQMAEHKALQTIYNMRNKAFQQGLVEQFIQCIGTYPTGSLVELSSGEVGVVLSQNSKYKLRPKVILVLDEHKNLYEKQRVFDLAGEAAIDVHIARSLDNHTYGVDVKQIGF